MPVPQKMTDDMPGTPPVPMLLGSRKVVHPMAYDTMATPIMR